MYMQKAMDLVLSDTMSVCEASVRFEVPKSTLHDSVKAVREGQDFNISAKLGRFENTFNAGFELQLANYVRDTDNRLMPFTRK